MEAIIRTDEMDRLDEVCEAIVARSDSVRADLTKQISRYRRLQTDAAEAIRQRLLGS